MENVKFQIRSINSYPLSMERRLQQGDAFRESSEKLRTSLVEIEGQLSKGNRTQDGRLSARSAKENRDLIRSCYCNFYLSSDPRAWHSHLPAYKREMYKLLNHTDEFPLAEINRTHNGLLEEHLLYDLTAGLPSDPREIRAIREMAFEAFQGRSNSGGEAFRDQILYFLSRLQDSAPTKAMADAVRELQTARGASDRSRVYINYYCSPSLSDTVSQKNFKAKFARMFDQGATHDEVYGLMEKEARSSKEFTLRNYRNELEGLQGALAAQQKLKARKQEKDRRMRDRETTLRTTRCSLQGCTVNLDLGEAQLECAICQWLDAKGSGCTRFFYCSSKHADEDFDHHDKYEHRCAMEGDCVFYPDSGPPEDSGDSGICQDCFNAQEVSYFCSQECYGQNLNLHREDYHMARGIHNDYNDLEPFKPAIEPIR